MKLIPLPADTKNNLGFNFKLMLDYTDLLAWTSGTAQAVLPVNAVGAATKTLLAGTSIGRSMINVTTAFLSSGGAITTLTFSLGDGSSATRFLNAVSLKTVAMTASTSALYAYTAADTVDVTATISGQTMASLNAGACELYLEVLNTAELFSVIEPALSSY